MDMKFNNANIDALLKIAAGKLNMRPEVLRKQLEEGRFDEAVKNMSPKDAAKFHQALKDPSALQKMMSGEQAKQMYRKMTGKEPN